MLHNNTYYIHVEISTVARKQAVAHIKFQPT